MSTFNKCFTKSSVFKCSAYATLLISLLNVVDSLGLNINFVHKLPLDSIGFNWVIPAIMGGLIGKFIIKDKNKEKNLNKVSA